jgi:hypothetical protein
MDSGGVLHVESVIRNLSFEAPRTGLLGGMLSEDKNANLLPIPEARLKY